MTNSSDATEAEIRLFELALAEARSGLAEGGIPIGAALSVGGEVIAVGRNERIQREDPIAHGEMSCLRNAGRQKSYRDMTLFTTLSPCQMCTGAVLLFGIPRIVVGEARTFAGDLSVFQRNGIEVVLLNDERCVSLMEEFQQRYPTVWAEDIGVIPA